MILSLIPLCLKSLYVHSVKFSTVAWSSYSLYLWTFLAPQLFLLFKLPCPSNCLWTVEAFSSGLWHWIFSQPLFLPLSTLVSLVLYGHFFTHVSSSVWAPWWSCYLYNNYTHYSLLWFDSIRMSNFWTLKKNTLLSILKYKVHEQEFLFYYGVSKA